MNTGSFIKNFPWPKPNGNKYDRGHAVVYGGPIHSTGAARLAAISALRVGAGLVSVACDEAALPVYAATLTSVMTKIVSAPDNFANLLKLEKLRGVLIGPGAGVTERTRDFTLVALQSQKSVVLDADVFSVFVDTPTALFDAIRSPCILTPHEGEFVRLFPDIDLNNRNKAAQQAAARSQAIVVLKGAKTVIAAPDGKTAVNPEASAFLATAGSGDVLAGLCLGLLSQGMDAYEAACTAVWLHAQAAQRLGPGLIAEDLPHQIPQVLTALLPV